MANGIFGKLLGAFEKKGKSLPDKRRTGHNFRYKLIDVLKSAFCIFLFQFPSMLNFQKAMKMNDGRREKNLTRILGSRETPSSTQITTLLDGIDPYQFGDVFNENLKTADAAHGVLASYEVLDGEILHAVDGVQYYSSKRIHCKHCLHKTTENKKTKEDVTTYSHGLLAVTIVKHGDTVILPRMGEAIRNEDGNKKQDCEIKAFIRYLSKHADECKRLKAIFLGDDLFSNYPICKAILDIECGFIFTCKEKSHPSLTETVKNSILNKKTRRERKGRHDLVYRYWWLNGVDIRDDKETLKVNYVHLEVENEKTKEIVYKNSWVTNKTVHENNVVQITNCARARWKIENEHNNVLKNHGYNFEHNFGHCQEHASDMYCLLILLAFLYHGILMLVEEAWQKAWVVAGRRTEFFSFLRAALHMGIHRNWDRYLLFVIAEEPG